MRFTGYLFSRTPFEASSPRLGRQTTLILMMLSMSQAGPSPGFPIEEGVIRSANC